MNVFKPKTPFTGIKQTDLAQAWQQNRETLNHISALFHVIIGGANSVAQTVMLDTIALLSKTNQYKGKAKHNAHLAVKRYNDFDRQNMDDMRNKQLDNYVNFCFVLLQILLIMSFIFGLFLLR